MVALAPIGLTVAGPATAGSNGSISGVVTDAKLHQAIEGLCVDASAPSGYNNYYYSGAARTDSNGSYTISNLPPADYLVTFRGCSPTDWVTQTYPHAYNGEDEKRVHVSAGTTTSGIDAQMEKYGVITGRAVRLSDGKPVGSVCVEVEESDRHGAGFLPHVGTNQDGVYTNSRVIPGDWVVFFGGCEGPHVAPTVYSSSGNRKAATVVHVSDGETVSGIDVTMPPDGRARGRLVNRQGQPVSNAPVRLWLVYGVRDDWGRQDLDTVTDAQGRYRFAYFTRGHYKISFGPVIHPRSYYHNVTSAADAKTLLIHFEEIKHLRVQTLRPRS